MAISPKALASWGLLSDTGGGIIQVTQVLQEMEVTLGGRRASGRGIGNRRDQRGVKR